MFNCWNAKWMISGYLKRSVSSNSIIRKQENTSKHSWTGGRVVPISPKKAFFKQKNKRLISSAAVGRASQQVLSLRQPLPFRDHFDQTKNHSQNLNPTRNNGKTFDKQYTNKNLQFCFSGKKSCGWKKIY